ncbi:DUF748 domain-containing protein [Pelagicoccus mobilis]|uniref:DUF748 domain-containing protein n=1 Tax=Pelagicoccus mobilis TaxID=415221 RepID=A0A934S280_9BACT|nr:DUF748 domain-containing protein [Pelagicoccus mobilis]MBK1877728.1 DUF748 domain-containing protein [Pelagicoccus mobilis]
MIQKSDSSKRWPKRLLISFVLAFTIYLCFGIWGVPAILKSQIQSKGSDAIGRPVRLDDVTFNPLSFETKLYGLSVGAKESDEQALLKIEKIAVNPQLFASLFGPVTVKSVSVEDGKVWVENDSTGRLSFQDILDRQNSTSAEGDESTGELPELIVESLRVEEVEVHYRDVSLTSAYEESIRLVQFEGTDLGTVERKGIEQADTPFHWNYRAQLETGSGAEVSVSGGAWSIAPWGFETRFELDGFDLATVQPFVDESVVATVEGMLGVELNSRVLLEKAGLQLGAEVAMDVSDFSLADGEQQYFAMNSFRVDGAKLDANAMDVSVEEIVVETPRALAVLQEDGRPLLPELKAVSDSGDQAGEAKMPNFSFRVASVKIANGSVELEDRSISNHFATDVRSLEMELGGLSVTQDDGELDASGELGITANVLGGNFELQSKLESIAGELTASITGKGLELNQLQNYVGEYSNANLDQGIVSFDMVARGEGLALPVVTGEFTLEQLAVSEKGTGRDLSSIARMGVEGIRFEEDRVSLETVRVEKPKLAVWQSERGVNLERIIRIEQRAEQAIEGVEAETGLAVSIGTLEVLEAGLGFVDTSTVSTHQSRVSEFNLTVNSISTAENQIADFSFDGNVDGGSVLEGSGKANISDPEAFMDLEFSFRGYDMQATSPYWETYLGRSLAKGQFELSSSFKIRDGQLEGSNGFKIDQLTLGQKVESDRAMSLPVGFAIKLMKDPSGVIEYPNLRVEGDLNSPDVRFWPLVGKACMNLVLNAAASPFKFLAGMVGGREDLDTIAFQVGSMSLDEEGVEKVEGLSSLMVKRPGLNLEVSYKPSPKEKEYLERQYLNHLLVNPEFQVASGVDLLVPVDEEILRANVQNLYLTLQAPDPLEETEVEDLSQELEAEPLESESEETGLLKRIASVLGLRKKQDEEGQPEEVVQSERVMIEAPKAEVADDLPSYEEMYDFVLANRGEELFDEEWLSDLAAERVQVFKQALLSEEGVDNSRIFTTGLAEGEGNAAEGALLLKLAE